MPRKKLNKPNWKLFQRGSVWYAQCWWNGRAHHVSTKQTDLSEAQIWLGRFIVEMETPQPPAVPTVSKMLDAYLLDRKGVRSPGTLQAAAKALRRHLGELEPDHLTKERIRRYCQERRAEGYQVGAGKTLRRKTVQDGTIIRELVTLRAALKLAKESRWIAHLPDIETPSAPPPRDRWLSREEAKRLLDSAGEPHIRVALFLCLYTAGRLGAVLELPWSQVDFAGGLIDLGYVEGGKHRAVVPIAEPLRGVLLEAKLKARSAYVVEYRGGRVTSVKTGARAAAVRAKLPGVTPHILRHTAATWMAQGGVPIERIARLLGHSDPRVTWKIYAKHSPGYLADAIAALAG